MIEQPQAQGEKMMCSNLQNGKCKINPNLPEILGCGKDTMCGFRESYHAE